MNSDTWRASLEATYGYVNTSLVRDYLEVQFTSILNSSDRRASTINNYLANILNADTEFIDPYHATIARFLGNYPRADSYRTIVSTYAAAEIQIKLHDNIKAGYINFGLASLLDSRYSPFPLPQDKVDSVNSYVQAMINHDLSFTDSRLSCINSYIANLLQSGADSLDRDIVAMNTYLAIILRLDTPPENLKLIPPPSRCPKLPSFPAVTKQY